MANIQKVRNCFCGSEYVYGRLNIVDSQIVLFDQKTGEMVYCCSKCWNDNIAKNGPDAVPAGLSFSKPKLGTLVLVKEAEGLMNSKVIEGVTDVVQGEKSVSYQVDGKQHLLLLADGVTASVEGVEAKKVVKEYHCPNCDKENSLWPKFRGRGRGKYYVCDGCGSSYSPAQLSKAWGRKKGGSTINVSVVPEGKMVDATCPACSATRARETNVAGVTVCSACGAVFGHCYKGESYGLVLPSWSDLPEDRSFQRYYDLTVLGSDGQTRRHGWFDIRNKKIVQTG